MWNTELKWPGFGIMNRMKVKGVVQVLHLPHFSESPLPPGFSCIILAFPNKNMTGDCAKVWQDVRCPDLNLYGKRGGESGEKWRDFFTQLQRGLRQIAALCNCRSWWFAKRDNCQSTSFEREKKFHWERVELIMHIVAHWGEGREKLPSPSRLCAMLGV